MREFVRAASVHDVAPGEVRAVRVRNQVLALVNTGANWYAVDNSCPHIGGPLASGYLDGTVLMCPLHGWRFDVTTGAGVMPEGASIGCFPVKVEGDDVLVAVG